MRVLFISGVPRSGTSLLEKFVRLHEDTVPLSGWDDGSHNEWEPRYPDGNPGWPWGSSQDHLGHLCNAYARLGFYKDQLRTNVSLYLSRAEQVVADGRRARRAAALNVTENATAFVKSPALLLRTPELYKAAARLGIEARFLLTTRSPTQWHGRGSKDCFGPGRALIMQNWERCHGRMQKHLAGLPPEAWYIVRLEDFGQIRLWRELEEWLGLVPTVTIGLASGQASSPGAVKATGSASAARAARVTSAIAAPQTELPMPSATTSMAASQRDAASNAPPVPPLPRRSTHTRTHAADLPSAPNGRHAERLRGRRLKYWPIPSQHEVIFYEGASSSDTSDGHVEQTASHDRVRTPEDVSWNRRALLVNTDELLPSCNRSMVRKSVLRHNSSFSYSSGNGSSKFRGCGPALREYYPELLAIMNVAGVR